MVYVCITYALYLRILKLAGILAKGLFTLFAYKGHVEGLHEWVVGLLLVALGAVEPFFAWVRALG